MPGIRWPVAVVLAVAPLAAGCGATAAAPGRLSGELKILAAASLTEAFTALSKAFEAEHRGVGMTFSFAASSALAAQLELGAPADVFASADEATMKRVTDAGLASDPKAIARNALAIVVPSGNPKGITGLRDLARPGLVFVLCAPQVPCGRLAAAALARSGVTARPASFEENVKAVVAKVVLGEADAGIVYATDVEAAGDEADGVAVSADPSLEAVSAMAITRAAANPAAARAWLDFVLSDRGRAVLARFGFVAP